MMQIKSWQIETDREEIASGGEAGQKEGETKRERCEERKRGLRN